MDSSQLTIIAVDPGKMTGWATLTMGVFASGQSDDISFLLWVDDVTTRGLRPSIVCEDFIYTTQTAKKTRQTYSTESIGVLRFLAAKYELSFTLQAPADAKRFATNDKLKQLDWYTPTKGGHANDAARHLLLYCIKNGLFSPRELLQPEHKET